MFIDNQETQLMEEELTIESIDLGGIDTLEEDIVPCTGCGCSCGKGT